jgi:D-xylose transport system ATP-binding protein
MTGSGTPPVLRAVGVSKRFAGVTALDGVSFDLRPGEIHALCGENGAGKSTLIKILGGILPRGSYEGRVEAGGREVAFAGPRDAARAGVAVIHQELALVEEMTVAENVFLGAEPTRLGRILWDRVYSDARTLVGRHELDLDPAERVRDLGTGRRQLVEIAKALSRDARILLLDEPTAALGDAEAEGLARILRDLRSRGMTLVYISHKLDEVLALADRVTVLRDGRSVATLDRSEATKETLVRHMVGREIRERFPGREERARAGSSLLEVEGLSVDEPRTGRRALDGISLAVGPGEVVGIGGLMGAGRSELLLHLFGAFGRRVGGRVTVDGRDFAPSGPAEAIGRGVMLVTEDRKRLGLHLRQSVGFNLSLAGLRRFARRGLLDTDAEVRSNAERIASLGIKAPGQETVVEHLSGGNQQKVVLGKALATEPRVLLLDEPTRGIDVGAKRDVYGVVGRLAAEGRGVLLATSEIEELLGLADRIVVLSEGRVGGTFARGEASPEAILRAAMAFHGRREARHAATAHDA